MIKFYIFLTLNNIMSVSHFWVSHCYECVSLNKSLFINLKIKAQCTQSVSLYLLFILKVL